MVRKKFFITCIVLLFIFGFCSSSYADTYVTLWDNMASYYGSLINFSTIPSTVGENDRYIFYYTSYWTGSNVAFRIHYTVFHNCSPSFYCTYSTAVDGQLQFYNFTGYESYQYNTETGSYFAPSINSNATSFSITHNAMITRDYFSVLSNTLPGIFMCNFDVLDASDNSKIIFHKNMNNSWLYFANSENLHLGGGENTYVYLQNNYNYSAQYEPYFDVYVGDSCVTENFYNKVYLNSFKLNSGNYSIPLNRIFKEDLAVGSVVWFILYTPDENGNYNPSFVQFKLTGSITIENYEPTVPDDEGGGSDNDLSGVIEGQQATTNAIQEQTAVQQEFNDNFFSDETQDPSSIDIQDNTQNNTADLSSFFSSIQSAFNSRDSQDKSFTLTLPNGDNFEFKFPKSFIRSFITGNQALQTFVSAFWYIVFGVYIIFDVIKMYNKFKNGDFEGAMHSSSVDNVVKEALR